MDKSYKNHEQKLENELRKRQSKTQTHSKF